MRVFNKIYIAKYQEINTPWQLSMQLETTKKEVDEVIKELKSTGKDKIYRNISDEEWEELEDKTEEYVLSRYANRYYKRGKQWTEKKHMKNVK